MPAGKNRRLTGQSEALERGAKFCRRVDAKRRVRTDDLREPALHRKLISHCIAANVRYGHQRHFAPSKAVSLAVLLVVLKDFQDDPDFHATYKREIIKAR